MDNKKILIEKCKFQKIAKNRDVKMLNDHSITTRNYA